MKEKGEEHTASENKRKKPMEKQRK